MPPRILPQSKLCRNTQLIRPLLREYPRVHRGFLVGFALTHNSHLTITYVDRKAEENKQWLIHTPDPGTSNLPSLFLHALHIALQKWEPPKTATVGSNHNKTILCALEHAAIQEGKNRLFRQLSSCQKLSSLSRCCYRRCYPKNPLNNRRRALAHKHHALV